MFIGLQSLMILSLSSVCTMGMSTQYLFSSFYHDGKSGVFITTIDAKFWMPEKVRYRYQSILENLNLDQIQESKKLVGKRLKSFAFEEASQKFVKQIIDNRPQLAHLALDSSTSSYWIESCLNIIRPFLSIDGDDEGATTEKIPIQTFEH
ncbi:hypothetical protein BDA99DRAFT_532095 [Phascolomyces articulosus]|uniref:Uncharacterized protein n=1 Tax=Phascolomyces articulosus TaxID=60185 RepID=A0AAD5KW66_9FUNG|nr:hypothetical protein BDA99DRAFT_532095 [Phascolomyces articulosus]